MSSNIIRLDEGAISKSNVFSVTPRSKMKEVAVMLKAIHAQENKAAAKEKAAVIAAKLRDM